MKNELSLEEQATLTRIAREYKHLKLLGEIYRAEIDKYMPKQFSDSNNKYAVRKNRRII